MKDLSRVDLALTNGDEARHAERLDQAREIYADAVASARELGDLMGEARALIGQATIARISGNLDWAIHDQEQAIALIRKAGDGCALARALREAADMFLEQEQLAHAAAHIREALDLYYADLEAPAMDFAVAMRSAAILAEMLGERDRAVELWTDTKNRYEAIDPIKSGPGATGIAEAELHLTQLA